VSTSVAMNSSGDAVVAWLQTETSSTAGSIDKLNVAARLYKSGAWKATAHNLDNQATQYRGFPVAGISDTGEAHVVWTAQQGTTNAAYAVHADSTGTWGAYPSALLYGATTPQLGDIDLAFAANGDGFAVATAYSGTTSSILASRFLEASKTWSGGAIVDSGPFNPGYLALSLGQAGPMAVWESTDNASNNRTERAATYGTIWGTPVTINQGTSGVGNDAVVATSTGFLTAWAQSTGAVSNINVDQFAGGSWGVPQIMGTGDYSGSSPALAADRHGNALLVWDQMNSGNAYDFVFSRFTGAARTWSSPAVAEHQTGTVLTSGGRVVIFGDGTGLGVWMMNDLTGSPYSNVFQ